MQRHYAIGEHLDIKDKRSDRVFDAFVVADEGEQNDWVRIRYSGMPSYYDQVIEADSKRLLKQWNGKGNMRIGNRLDVLHKIGGWLQAVVIELHKTDPYKVKVHYTGYKPFYDNWINLFDH